MTLLSGAPVLLADEDTDKAGPLGLLVILVLVVVCYFLFKSMSKHLRKVRDDFPAGDPGAAGAGDSPSPGGSGVRTRPGLASRPGAPLGLGSAEGTAVERAAERAAAERAATERADPGD